MRNRQILIIAALCLCLLLCACGQTAAEPAATPAPVETAAPTPTPTPVPTPTPTPFVEPETAPGGLVTFDGVELESGTLLHEGLGYVKLSEVARALDLELERDGQGGFAFDWRKSRVELAGDSDTLRYLDEDRALEGPALLCQEGEDLLVPVESFCDGAEIGLLYDEENDHLYCTPGAGNWAVPEGYNVPVMMYHGVGYGSPDANLFVNTEDMEAQIVWLLDNGYTPIWFEDLWHVEDFNKPILLTYDDGWYNCYENLLPLVEKYQIKVTIFVVWHFMETSGNHFHLAEAKEMADTGLIAMESHTVNHIDLTYLDPDEREYQLAESRLNMTRFFGKEPCALSYPIGGSNEQIEEMTRQYYHFAVKMMAYPDHVYNTSDDPMLIYRFFPEKLTPMHVYQQWCLSAFPEDTPPEEPSPRA